MAVSLLEFIQVRIKDDWSVIPEDKADEHTLTATILKMPDDKTLIASVAEGFIKSDSSAPTGDIILHLQPTLHPDTPKDKLRRELQDKLQSIINVY